MSDTDGRAEDLPKEPGASESGDLTSSTAESPSSADEAAKESKEETSIGRWLVETAILVLLAFALAQGIKTFIVQPFVIPTGSMRPTILEQDYVLAEKLTYRFSRQPRYRDIVVFDDPSGQHPQLIKRVIAVAGQTVDIRDDAVYVDGKRLSEPYTHGKPSLPGTIRTPLTLKKGEVWLMGDNRTNSADSRYFGPRPVNTIHGRAFWRYLPLNRFGEVE